MNSRPGIALCAIFLILACARTAPASHQAQKIRIDGPTEKAKIIHMVKPVYPREAKEKGIHGIVNLSVLVGKDGHVKKIRVESGPPILVKASVVAIRQWVYEKTFFRGKPVEFETSVTFYFELPRHPKGKKSHK